MEDLPILTSQGLFPNLIVLVLSPFINQALKTAGDLGVELGGQENKEFQQLLGPWMPPPMIGIVY